MMDAKAENARLLRQMVWDIIPCEAVPAFMEPLGLVPSSAEGYEHEHQESHDRLDRIAPIAEEIDDLCHASSHVITACALRTDRDEVEPGIEEHLVAQNETVLFAGVTAILAKLVDDGTVVLVHG